MFSCELLYTFVFASHHGRDAAPGNPRCDTHDRSSPKNRAHAQAPAGRPGPEGRKIKVKVACRRRTPPAAKEHGCWRVSERAPRPRPSPRWSTSAKRPSAHCGCLAATSLQHRRCCCVAAVGGAALPSEQRCRRLCRAPGRESPAQPGILALALACRPLASTLLIEPPRRLRPAPLGA